MAVLIPSRNRCREGGEYYVAMNPTLLTGLANQAAPVAFDATKGFLTCRNGDQTGGKSIVPDFLKLICTAPGTAGTFPRVIVSLDDDAGNTKWTSGGTLLAGTGSPTPGALSPNGRQGASGIATVHAGALVTVAGPAERRVANAIFRTTIPVIGDEYTLLFGTDAPEPSSPTLNGTNPISVVKHAPAVEIAPKQVMTVYLILPSQSAASSWEPQLGYWEIQGQ